MTELEYLCGQYPQIADRYHKAVNRYNESEMDDCAMQLGIMAEQMLSIVCENYGLDYINDQVDRINTLVSQGVMSQSQSALFHTVRKTRNYAVHNRGGAYPDKVHYIIQNRDILVSWFVSSVYVPPQAVPEYVPRYTSAAPSSQRAPAAPSMQSSAPAVSEPRYYEYDPDDDDIRLERKERFWQGRKNQRILRVRILTAVTAVLIVHLITGAFRGDLQYIHIGGKLLGYIGWRTSVFSTEIRIPDGITAIPDDMFKENRSVRRVYLPDSVTSIGDNAFFNCRNLEEINIPASVGEIGAGAFQGCEDLQGIRLPETLTTVSDSQFRDCSKLQNVTMGGEVTSIGEHAFRDCSRLRLLKLPPKVTTVYASSFQYCDSLTLLLHSNVASIQKSEGSVLGAGQLYAPKDSYAADYLSQNHVEYQLFQSGEEPLIFAGFVVEEDRLVSYLGYEEDVTIPEGITIVDNDAFKDASFLKRVTFPDGITVIGDSAFSGCGSLEEVQLNDGLLEIRDAAFSQCGSLSRIQLPQTLRNLGNEAFGGTALLGEIAIPESIETFGIGIFRDSSAKPVYKPGSKAQMALE